MVLATPLPQNETIRSNLDAHDKRVVALPNGTVGAGFMPARRPQVAHRVSRTSFGRAGVKPAPTDELSDSLGKVESRS